jgi:acyl-CoA hydrolase
MNLTPKRAKDSETEMVQAVLPNDANPLGFILGGTVMHLIDIAGAIACHRHTRTLLVTAAVDGLEFLHPIKVGDLIILRSRVTCVFTTSLEVRVEVHSEETLTGSVNSPAGRSHLRGDRSRGNKLKVPPLLVESDEERRECEAATARRQSVSDERRKRIADSREPLKWLSAVSYQLSANTLEPKNRSIEIDRDTVLLRNLWPTMPPS